MREKFLARRGGRNGGFWGSILNLPKRGIGLASRFLRNGRAPLVLVTLWALYTFSPPSLTHTSERLGPRRVVGPQRARPLSRAASPAGWTGWDRPAVAQPKAERRSTGNALKQLLDGGTGGDTGSATSVRPAPPVHTRSIKSKPRWRRVGKAPRSEAGDDFVHPDLAPLEGGLDNPDFWPGKIPKTGWTQLLPQNKSIGIFPRPASVLIAQQRQTCASRVRGCCVLMDSAPLIISANASTLHEATVDYLRAEAALIFGNESGPYELFIEVLSPLPGELPQGSNEWYSLYVGEHRAFVRAETTAGAIHGFWSFVSLFSRVKVAALGKNPRCLEMAVPLYIRDSPRYEYRSLLIDAPRHPYTVPDLEDIVEMMARLKFNVLHLRLTDDTGFLLENSRVDRCLNCTADKLQGVNISYADDELRGLVTFAAVRGVRIVPEVDLPAHAKSWGDDLATCCPSARQWGIPLKLTNEATYTAVKGVLEQVSSIFPDPFLHLGGDEISRECFDKGNTSDVDCNGELDTRICTDLAGCLRYFETRLRQIVDELPEKRTVIRWMDLLERQKRDPGLSPLIMDRALYGDNWGMSWRGFNEILVLLGIQDHYSTFMPIPPQFPLLVTSENWYIPPRPNIDQQSLNFECDRCFDRFYNSPWGRSSTMHKAKSVYGPYRIPEAFWSRFRGGTVAGFEVSMDILTKWHSWALVAAVAERLWSSEDPKSATEAFERLTANIAWASWQPPEYAQWPYAWNATLYKEERMAGRWKARRG